MLAVDGETTGPYLVCELKDYIEQNGLNPQECHVWQEGMANWISLNQVPKVAMAFVEESRLVSMAASIRDRGKLGIESNLGKTLGWFALVNAAIVISVILITGGAMLGLAPVLLLFGSIFPLISLAFSKGLAKKAHDITILEEGNLRNESERELYALVESLSQRAGLEQVPEVGIYESADPNAFATGMNKKNALVSFSSGLLENIDEQGISGVAAHEIAHIVNGDMLTLTLIQSVVNGVAILITLPLQVLRIAALFSEDIGIFGFMVISFFRAFVSAVVLFFGNLVVKAFSRKREYAADELAASLIDPESMVYALQSLSRNPMKVPKEQAAFSAFKISAQPAWVDIFSTHPSIEKRIARLKESH
jgi:heat shock protein HtpX